MRKTIFILRKTIFIKSVMLALIMLAAALFAGCEAEHEPERDFPRLENLPRHAAADAPPRFHAGPVNEFIPMDYGEIFPFLGQINVNDWGWGDVQRFGFIDSYGRIICDPIFTEVTRLEHGDNHAWVVSSRHRPAGHDERDFFEGREGFAAVISADGSFFGEFDEVYTGNWLVPFDYEFIPVMRDGKWGLIDFYGNEILPFAFPNAPLFSDGLAAVYRWAEHEHLFEYLMNLEPFYYINISGETVLGPFRGPPVNVDMGFGYEFIHLEVMMFQDGLAIHFYDGDYEDGRYGFIDGSGDVVIPHDFLFFNLRQFGWNDAGLALVALADTLETVVQVEGWGEWTQHLINYALIDREGNIIVTMPHIRTYGMSAWDDYFTLFDFEQDFSAAFDRYGNEVTYDGTHLGNGYFQMSQHDEQRTLIEMRITGNGVDLTFEEEGLLWAHILFGDWLSMSFDDESRRMFNLQTGESRDMDFISIHNTLPDRNVANVSDWDNPRMGVFNDAGDIVIDFAFDILRPIGENYFAAQGRYGGLVGPDGEWLIRTRLTGNFD